MKFKLFNLTILIDLFSLCVLFSHFRPRDATLGNSFFLMSSYARANVRITIEKKQKENSHEGITWCEMEKQNVQAKTVYCRIKLKLGVVLTGCTGAMVTYHVKNLNTNYCACV